MSEKISRKCGISMVFGRRAPPRQACALTEMNAGSLSGRSSGARNDIHYQLAELGGIAGAWCALYCHVAECSTRWQGLQLFRRSEAGGAKRQIRLQRAAAIPHYPPAGDTMNEDLTSRILATLDRLEAGQGSFRDNLTRLEAGQG